ncbi:hypothetical protein W823_22455 [Williamsia sp. D3]|nr:hypothetical protein W823_22455 [Williamsia sp. D3]
MGISGPVVGEVHPAQHGGQCPAVVKLGDVLAIDPEAMALSGGNQRPLVLRGLTQRAEFDLSRIHRVALAAVRNLLPVGRGRELCQ